MRPSEQPLLNETIAATSAILTAAVDVMLNGTNDTNSNSSARVDHRASNRIEFIVLCTILVLAIFGNGCVLLALFYKQGTKLTRMNFYIMQLSVADLCVGLFHVLPTVLEKWYSHPALDDALCRIIRYLAIMPIYASTYILMVTAFDRYSAICHPLSSQTWTRCRGHFQCLAAWLISILFSIPQFFVFHRNERGMCRSTLSGVDLQIYVVWSTLSIYIIPLVVLGLCYGIISRTIRINAERKRDGQLMVRIGAGREQSHWVVPGSKSIRNVFRAKQRTFRMTLVVVIAFALCFGPYYITSLIYVFSYNKENPPSPLLGRVMGVLLILLGLNSCTNPWIYLVFTGNMRRLRSFVGGNRHRMQDSRRKPSDISMSTAIQMDVESTSRTSVKNRVVRYSTEATQPLTTTEST